MVQAQPQIPQEHPFGAPPSNLPKWQPAPSTRRDGRGVRVERIDLARHRQRHRFLKMVPELYVGDPNFINPLWVERMMFLNPKRNTALENLDIEAMLAYRGTRCVGRMTAHVDRAYNRYHGCRTGWFGFFECVDDRDVAHAMLERGMQWLKERNMAEAIGPNNFTTNHQVGLLVENFNRPPCVEMTYNPPYYEQLLTSYGFAKAKDLHSYWIDVTAGLDNPKFRRFQRVGEKVKQRYGLSLRHARLDRLDEEVAILFTLYNESWQKNWGFVPVSEREFAGIANDLKQILIEELVLIVEHNGKPVGFSVTLPDVNEAMPRDGRLLPTGWLQLLRLKKTRHARLLVLGVLPAFRKRGVEALLCLETALVAKRLGMSGGEIGWTLEDNHLVNSAAESMGAKLDRKYRLLGMALE